MASRTCRAWVGFFTSFALAQPASSESAALPSPAERALGTAMKHYETAAYGLAQRAFAELTTAPLKNVALVRFYLAQSAYYAGDHAVAARYFHELAADKSRFAALAAFREADALAVSGHTERARSAYERVLATDNARIDTSAARFRFAELLASHEPKRAAAEFLRIYLDAPMHPAASQALENARSLGAVVEPRDLLRRAHAFGRAHEWGLAATTLAPLVGADATRKLQYGMALYRTRKQYSSAATVLFEAARGLPVTRRDEALFYGARALSRAHDDEAAIRKYEELVAQSPRGKFTAEAQFLAGWLRFNAGRYASAIPALTRAAKGFPAHRFAEDARWFLALANYLGGRLAESQSHFEKLKRTGRRLGALYWSARIAEQQKAEGRARELYLALALEHPFDWYGLLGRARLRASGAEPPWPSLPAARGLPDRTPSGPIPARVHELVRAGILHEATLELDSLSTPRDLAEALGLIDLAKDADDWHRVYRTGHALFATHRTGDSGRRVWEAYYPLAFSASLQDSARHAEVPATLITAIMRKESGFDPSVVSYANAIGLLQLLPETAARLASGLGHEVATHELFQPRKNLELGATYIGKLFRKFRGQVPFVAAAFNGGAPAMMRWKARFKGRELDEAVELIPFHQSREYSKQVSANFAVYEWLYSRHRYVPTLDINLDFAGDDVDF